jgi:hypothetical protein
MQFVDLMRNFVKQAQCYTANKVGDHLNLTIRSWWTFMTLCCGIHQNNCTSWHKRIISDLQQRIKRSEKNWTLAITAYIRNISQAYLRKCLRIKLNRFKPVSMLVDITSNTFYKCTATLRKQICRRCLRIKLNGFRSVKTLMHITFNTFCKCTVALRTHCMKL